jgi:hypothetical protein
MKASLLLFLLTTAVAGPVQQHASSTEQCRADHALWVSQFNEYDAAFTLQMKTGAPNRATLNIIGVQEIYARSVEMFDCKTVDRRREESYAQLGFVLVGVAKDRYVRFVERHSLKQEFYDEDAAGVR